MRKVGIKALSILGAIYIFVLLVLIIRIWSPRYYITVYRVTLPRHARPYIISSSTDLFLAIPYVLLLPTIVSYLEGCIKLLLLLPPLGLLSFLLRGSLSILLGLMGILGCLIISRLLKSLGILFRCLLIICLILEIGSLTHWILHPLFPRIFTNDPKHGPAWLETQLFYSLNTFNIPITLLFLFSWILRPIIRWISRIRYIRIKKEGIILGIKEEEINDVNYEDEFLIFKRGRICLLTAIIVSIMLSLYPYIPSINPRFVSISVDVWNYYRWFNEARAGSLLGTFRKGFRVNSGSRPLTFVVIYILHKIVKLPLLDLLKLMVAIVIPLLPFSIYVLCLTTRKRLACLASLITSVSPMVLVGIYAGYYSQMMALFTVYLAQAFLLFSLGNFKFMIISSVIIPLMLLAAFLIHVWTGLLSIGILVIYTLISVILYCNNKDKIRRRASVLVIIYALIAIVVSLFIQREGVRIGYVTAMIATDFFRVIFLESILPYTIYIYDAGFIINWLYGILAFLGVISLNPRKNPLDRMLLSWLIVCSLPFITSNTTLQIRFLFSIPTPILAALGLERLTSLEIIKKHGMIIRLLLLIALLNNAIRSVSNIIPHSG